jgi:hypothetical protein
MPSQKGSSGCGYSASFSAHLAVAFGGYWLKLTSPHIMKKLVAMMNAAEVMAENHLPDHSAVFAVSSLDSYADA